MSCIDVKSEVLKDDIKIYTTKSHYFGSDAFLLAHFSAPKKHEKTIDFGTGCGIIPMLWACENPSLEINAIEIQPDAASLASRSANQAGFNINVVLGDINDLAALKNRGIEKASHHLITMNPPYFANGAGIQNPDPSHAIARHEGAGCTFNDAAHAASELLRFGGRFCFCHRPDRLPDILSLLKKHKLEPKKLRFAHIRASKAPWLFLCEARKGGNPELSVSPPFLTYLDNGAFSEEYRRIYKWYRK